MRLGSRTWAGLCFFLAGAQFSIGLIVAEAVYPGYSVSGNFISDLGVGPAANVFNGSVIALGLLAVAGAYIARKDLGRVLIVLIVLTGIGAIGVGVFTEAFGIIHTIVSFVAFLFGGLSAIWAFRLTRPPLSYLSLLLGIFGLVALGLFISRITLGLGVGGMERMIVYPVLAWGMGFGGYLMASAPLPADRDG